MSGEIVAKPEHAENAWRQRGYTDGFSRKPERAPADAGQRQAYQQGYRRGAEARSKVRA